MTSGATSFTDPKSVADAFAQHFASVYTTSQHREPRYQCGIFSFTKVTETEVLKSIKKLKHKKSSGADGIPSYIYKGCQDSLLGPLTYIFNLSLQQNIFPDSLKNGVVTPIHKSGNKSDITNYRPSMKKSMNLLVTDCQSANMDFCQVDLQYLTYAHLLKMHLMH